MTATLTLSGTAATVAGAAIVLVTVKQTFDIGWAIGTVAEGKISDVQWGLKQYDKESRATNSKAESHSEGIPEPDSPFISPGKWQCKALCDVQAIGKTKCPERVYGRGGDSTEESACREAKRAATQSTPRGCYPRHCRCDCEKS